MAVCIREYIPPSRRVQRGPRPVGLLPIEFRHSSAAIEARQREGESWVRGRDMVLSLKDTLLQHDWLIVAAGKKWATLSFVPTPDDIDYVEEHRWTVRCPPDKEHPEGELLEAFSVSLVLDCAKEPVVNGWSHVEVIAPGWGRYRKIKARKMHALFSRLVKVPEHLRCLVYPVDLP